MPHWSLFLSGSVIAILIFRALIRQYFCFRIVVPTASMAPTIVPGDHILVRWLKAGHRLDRGDLLVFRSTKRQKGAGDLLMIKRLIGLPGETIELRDGLLLVNGQIESEHYIKFQKEFNGNFEIPKGSYLFLGDNRASSNDARYWEVPWVTEKEIIAKAGLRIWPMERFGFIQ